MTTLPANSVTWNSDSSLTVDLALAGIATTAGSFVVRVANSPSGPWSAPIPFTVLTTGGGAGTVPAAPTTLSAIPDDSSVTIFWNVPPSNGGSQITGYKVQSATSATGTFTTVATVGAAVTSNKIIGLTNGSAYFFRVLATNSVGDSVPSLVATATPTASGPTPDDPAWRAAFDAGDLTTLHSWYSGNTGYLANGFDPADLWAVGNDPTVPQIITTSWLATHAAPGKVEVDGSGNWTVTGLHCQSLSIRVSNVEFSHCFMDRGGAFNVPGVEVIDPSGNSNISATNTNLKLSYCTMHGGTSWKITNKSLTGNVATLTIADDPLRGPHNITVGTQLDVRTSPYDTAFTNLDANGQPDGSRMTVTAVTATTVSYARTHADVPSTVCGGRVSISPDTLFGDAFGFYNTDPTPDKIIAEYCEATSYRAGFLSWAGVHLRYCYVHDLDFFSADPHNTAASIRGAGCTFERCALLDGTSSDVSLYADTYPFTNFSLIENTFSVDPQWAVLEVNFPLRSTGWSPLEAGFTRVLRNNKFQRGACGDNQYFSEVTGNKLLATGEDVFGGGTPQAERVTGTPCTLTGFTAGFPGYGAYPPFIQTWAFTPSSNSTLFLLHGMRNGGHSTPQNRTVTDTSGDVWTPVPGALTVGDGGTYNITEQVFQLTTGTVPTWRKVTVDPFDDPIAVAYQSMFIFEVPGIAGMTLVQPAKLSVVSAPYPSTVSVLVSGTLNQAATPGNLVCAFYVTTHDDGESRVTAPANWHNLGNFKEKVVTTGMMWRRDFNGTSMTIPNLGPYVQWAAMILCEFA